MGKPAVDPVRRRVAPPRRRPTRPLPPGRVISLPGLPEDVIAEADGRLLAGLDTGVIVRYDPASGATTTVAKTGGRPLGLELLPDGRVLVCCAGRGLLRADPDTGQVETLVESIGGRRLRFCSNAAAGADGTIWFTESTDRFDFEHYRGALLEQRPSGGLYRRDPDGAVETVQSGLYFANGVALTPDGSALYFVETGDYAVNRLDITGPDQGRRQRILDNLSGFPDNMSRFSDGRAWIAIVNPRFSVLDRLADTPPVLRKVVWRIPEKLQPPVPQAIHVIAIDPAGAVVDEVFGHRDDFESPTGAVQIGDTLYLASLTVPAILEVDLTG